MASDFDQLLFTYGPVGGFFIWVFAQWWLGRQNAPKTPAATPDKPITRDDLDDVVAEMKADILREIDATRGAVYDVGKAVAAVNSVTSEVRGMMVGAKR